MLVHVRASESLMIRVGVGLAILRVRVSESLTMPSKPAVAVIRWPAPPMSPAPSGPGSTSKAKEEGSQDRVK